MKTHISQKRMLYEDVTSQVLKSTYGAVINFNPVREVSFIEIILSVWFESFECLTWKRRYKKRSVQGSFKPWLSFKNVVKKMWIFCTNYLPILEISCMTQYGFAEHISNVSALVSKNSWGKRERVAGYCFVLLPMQLLLLLLHRVCNEFVSGCSFAAERESFGEKSKGS